MARLGREKIEEIARTILGAMQPSFTDYRGYKGEFEVKNKKEAVLAFMNTTWSTPVSMVLYAVPTLGLKYPIGGPTPRIYRKKGKGNVYRVCLDFEYEENYIPRLIFTTYWDVKVEKRGRGKKRIYYCELIDYGVLVCEWGSESIRPILKL